MTEDESTQRLANRLADLRELGDRHRANHPVSILRSDIVTGQPGEGLSEAPSHEPTLEDRAEVLARRVLSPVVARAEQLAAQLRTHQSAELGTCRAELKALRATLETMRDQRA